MTRRLHPEQLERLLEAVCRADPVPDGEQRRAARAVYALLRAGQPVTRARLAAAAGVPPAHAEGLLRALPNVEFDDEGAAVGFGGLTLRPTPHRIVVDGRERYAWCAWDTLFLPVALETAIDVASRCPQTGRSVTLKVTPTGVVEREPPDAVLSFPQPGSIQAADLRGSFCGAVHFLADAAAAKQWAGQLVLDLDEAFELGRRMILERYGPC